MKLVKRILPLVLALALALGCAVFADAASAKHTEEKYLRDTLTLAGSGFGSVRTLTVAAIEDAAAWALEQDLLPALAGGDTAPGAGATRAEAACTLARMIKEG